MSRFLLIGLDGAEPSLVEAWMAEGRLPHLAELRMRGAYLPCASTTPPATFPAWTTCVTGVNPGRHGIFDFSEVVAGRYAIRFVNSTFRKRSALWNVLGAAGKRVGIIGVPGTYPPETVNGFMVSGFDSPVCTRVDASFVHPRELYPAVKEWQFADFQESEIGPGWHENALSKLLEGVAIKEEIALQLFAREPWDFFMVVFGESDTVAHHFWMFHDANSPRYRPGHEHAIRQVYERLDAAVGRLVAAARAEVTIGVVSDHGFGGAGTGVIHINNWLAEQGYLRFSRDRGSWLKSAALAITPASLQGALFRRFQTWAARAESGSRFGGIDWAHTSAWSEELNYFPSVRVNLKGREPLGQVEPERYDEFCAELCERLEASPVVKKAWRRSELYSGDHVDRAPDIVLELALEDGYSYSCLRSRGGPAIRRIRPEQYVGGKERGMNGNHRPTGVLFLSRPVAARDARLEDVASTVLACLGVSGPEMEGRNLFEPGGRLDRSDKSNRSDAEQSYSPEEEQVIEARLRALGYLE